MNLITLIKFVGAWTCLILAMLGWLIKAQPSAVTIWVLLSLAFAMAPASW